MQEGSQLLAPRLHATRIHVSQPSKTLIKAICYLDQCKISTVATRWGFDKEEVAKAQLLQELCVTHM